MGGMFIGGVWHIPGIFLVDGRQEVTSVKGGGVNQVLSSLKQKELCFASNQRQGSNEFQSFLMQETQGEHK